MIILKRPQQEAVERVLNRFSEARELLRLDVSADDRETARRAASVMLEAPTGAGKTLMAGTVVERFSEVEGVVWFWFAPFKGLVEQSERFLRRQFRGLRVRDLRVDRDPRQARGGDIYVTTWASVAAADKEGRKVRQAHESLASLDELVPLLRERGLRIGVVVDEAHHSLRSRTQAGALFRDVLAPDYTLMATATPDEREMLGFARELGRESPERVILTREQAVGMGLVKRGIKTVAYLADAAVGRIVDYEKTALADGWRAHCEIKAELARVGIGLVPLMLVQVQTSGAKDDEKRVKDKLLELGVPEEAIAVHTAREPDPDVLAAANDERIEVLVFKMKVALGFDAPRAFVLVSSRASRKASFGIQVCGRILRVHRRLQGRDGLPAIFDFGYVFLADAESQEGLVEAARTIDQVRGELEESGTPAVIAVKIGDRYTIQRVGAAGASLLHGLDDKEVITPQNVADWLVHEEMAGGETAYLEGLEMGEMGTADAPLPAAGQRRRPSASSAPRFSYKLRLMPPRLRTHMLPIDYNGLAEDVVAIFDFTERMLLDGQRELVEVTRRETEAFSGETERERVSARLSPRAIARMAQGYLLELEGPNPAVIRDGLRERLRQRYRAQGLAAADDPEKIKNALNLIMTMHPQALRMALKQSLVRYAPVEDTFEPMPSEIYSDEELPRSTFNLYGVRPPGLNSWERAFVELLDNDLSGIVQWWHRNQPFHRDAVCVPLASGRGYYPDFVVCLKGRKERDGILLVETKERIYDPLAAEKIEAAHKEYGRPLMLTLEDGRFMSVRINSQTQRAEIDRAFSLDWAAAY